MSVEVAPRSIYTPTKQTALATFKVIDAKAKGDIRDNTDISTTVSSLFADADKFTEALQYTGYQTELLQEQLAELASTNYGNYLAARDQAKSMMRGEVLRVWAFLKNLYSSVGFPEEEAKAKATEAAKPYKDAQREVFLIMFPLSGEKVVNRY